MTGLVRKTILLSAAGLMAAGAVWAAVPSPATSNLPTGINVVGYLNPPDPRGIFTYVIRDAQQDPMPDALVEIDFSLCTDIRLCTTNSTTVPPGGTTACPGSKIWRGTTGNGTNAPVGQISFTLVGGGNGAGPARLVAACATVIVNSQPFPDLIVSAFDHNGAGGVNAPDLSVFGSDFVAQLGGIYRGRSDYDKSGEVRAPDLSLFGRAFVDAVIGGFGSVLSCVDCP